MEPGIGAPHLSTLPSLARALGRYGSSDPARAPYVVIGVVDTPRGRVGGLLAFADNEVHAHLLKRELARYGVRRFGGVGVKRTSAHPDGPSFDVLGWRSRVRALPLGCRSEDGDLAAQPRDAGA